MPISNPDRPATPPTLPEFIACAAESGQVRRVQNARDLLKEQQEWLADRGLNLTAAAQETLERLESVLQNHYFNTNQDASDPDTGIHEFRRYPITDVFIDPIWHPNVEAGDVYPLPDNLWAMVIRYVGARGYAGKPHRVYRVFVLPTATPDGHVRQLRQLTRTLTLAHPAEQHGFIELPFIRERAADD